MPEKNQLILANDYCINFNPKNSKLKYSVEIDIDDNVNLNIISYNVEVSYTKEPINKYYLAEVIITNFRLNFQTPDAVMEILALKCRESIEKCIFRINTKNEIIEIENHQEILQRWYTIKESLIHENEGEIFEKYISIFENNILNEDSLLVKIKKNLFINQYFFPIFNEPYHNLNKNNDEQFSFFNLDYQEQVVLEVENKGIFDENEMAIISKKLMANKEKHLLLPIESYASKYILNKNTEIAIIEGAFSNFNNKYSYKIELIN